MKCNNKKINYQLMLDNELKKIVDSKRVPRLLLHACCAPCSSYCLEYLTNYFDITILFYNPNITETKEFEFRYSELVRLVNEMPKVNDIRVIKGSYEPEKYFSVVKGHEKDPERGERCDICYKLRLEQSYKYALDKDFDYITTTLTISPLKKADALNNIGKELSEKYNIPYLYSDFKKKEGYKRSIELSSVYGLYRQDYCGCIFSKKERLRSKENSNLEE